jgi:serine/threonine protein kinase
MNEDSIFAEASEKKTPEEREAFLDEACKGDSELRRNIESLLAAYDQGEFLESPAHAIAATLDQPPSVTEKPGTQIGPYKLLQQIGEGGMGVVYMAEQTEPVERRVALKIIKPGMDTRQVIARFEAERQALALMDHPSIAKVLDAGTTESGRPYFVMELVRGIPLTEYCDQNHLDTKTRLRLFASILHAVQHAHQKGIIHRDLKPSNVMIAEYDDKPVPKIIDFGVAKATGHKLTEKTMFTHFGQLVGTLEYMSPEQAKLNQLDVDTRSDIYSLGVLLYELLTGNTPIEKERLRSAAFDEVLRIIREEEPPRPSLRLSTVDTLATVAENRRVEPKKLPKLVRGELDWIVMKALAKDRTDRYETAASFADDVERYLDDEPVEACPPTMAYRLRKFARRNKAVFAGIVALAVVAVVSGIAAMKFLQLATERNAALVRLQNMGVHWYAFRVPKWDPHREFGVYTLTSDGKRQFHGAFSLPDQRGPVKGWVMFEGIDKETIRCIIDTGGSAHECSFPNPMQHLPEVELPEGNRPGTLFTTGGLDVSPGDVLFRFSPIGRYASGDRVIDGNVAISFGFE